jgi:hypothetical protein
MRCKEAWHLQPAGSKWVPSGALFSGVAFLGMLGAKAVAVGDMSKSGFVAAALRELSEGLCKGNYLMHRSLLGVLAGVAGLKRCGRKKAAWLAPFLYAASLFSILLV